MTIWVYKFEDGTTLELYKNGLSAVEIWKLQELHGKNVVRDFYEIARNGKRVN